MARSAVLPLILGLAVFSACGGQDDFPSPDELDVIRNLYRPPSPGVDPTNRYADDPGARALGEKLFSDPGVSSCGTVSCETCHPGPNYTVDTPKAHGCGGETARNPPSLLNAAYAEWFMWDGSKDTLWAQPMGPLLNPVEMAATPAGLQALLASKYAADYEAVFGKRPQDETDPQRLLANFGKAMAAYERTLIRVRSPFDDKVEHFLASAAQGQAAADPFYPQLRAFVRRGRCTVCHKSPSLSDGLFHNLGLSEGSGPVDPGRDLGIDRVLADPFNSASEYSDAPADGQARLNTLGGARVGTEGAFKTPSLRNTALTGPYMHNGSLADIDQVIEFYNRGGDASGFAGVRTDTLVPLYLSDSEKAAIKDLLLSLTGSENP